MSSKIEPVERARSIRIRDAIVSHLASFILALLFWWVLRETYGLDLQHGLF